MEPRIAICFLVINKMQDLPELAITSAYDRTGVDILIGYLEKNDLPTLRPDVRVTPLLLQNQFATDVANLNGDYKDFSEDTFYEIVQYKWQLLEDALKLDYDYIIYSDTDVYWNKDPLPEIVAVFRSREEVSIQIQSFTDLLSQPKLCMGFVALKKSETSLELLSECKSRHKVHSQEIGRIGDDEIVTQFYADKNFPNSILELPQTTFPVGRMLKLYSTTSKYPGLPSPEPFIFHANYVIGLRNKIILMKIFIRNYSTFENKVKYGITNFSILQILKLRLFLSRIKNKIF
jgi:hypothetical protein